MRLYNIRDVLDTAIQRDERDFVNKVVIIPAFDSKKNTTKYGFYIPKTSGLHISDLCILDDHHVRSRTRYYAKEYTIKNNPNGKKYNIWVWGDFYDFADLNQEPNNENIRKYLKDCKKCEFKWATMYIKEMPKEYYEASTTIFHV